MAFTDLVEGAGIRGESCAIGICEDDCRAVAPFDVSASAIVDERDYPSLSLSTIAPIPARRRFAVRRKSEMVPADGVLLRRTSGGSVPIEWETMKCENQTVKRGRTRATGFWWQPFCRTLRNYLLTL